MKYGYYSDSEIPKNTDIKLKAEYKVNSDGYRCPEWSPMPVGKKNVAVLGCSHTFGEGLNDGEVWVDQLYELVDQRLLRFWNLGQPGASAEKIVRILYGTEKVIFPKIIIICWPVWSRRERLDEHAQSLTSHDSLLKTENENTDKNNFLKNVFFAEKFAERQAAKLFHCFAQDIYEIKNSHRLARSFGEDVYHMVPNDNVFASASLKSCWPRWDNHNLPNANRTRISTPSLAKDGVHYGADHHKTFANLLFERFKTTLASKESQRLTKSK